MSNYTVKAHHAIMLQTAIADYNLVVEYLNTVGLKELIRIPRGASWQKVEDATALMIKSVAVLPELRLNRGLDYYKSL